MSCLAFFVRRTPLMSASPSELVALARLNGDFRKNYGRLIGAFLYLRSISVAHGRPFFWSAVWAGLASAGLTWLEKHSLR
jgi:hypothetical protein